ncbi:hypothetical protein HK100_006450 [Physocladia obscura]|uniref:Uncharacterized protein n=1 Tax=Physocladia obscura TaxID=109957 RepID=A0AAD5TAY6_9FUNG|nr:hypothetical protein HK100_006450 [Physocladia obscura]
MAFHLLNELLNVMTVSQQSAPLGKSEVRLAIVDELNSYAPFTSIFASFLEQHLYKLLDLSFQNLDNSKVPLPAVAVMKDMDSRYVAVHVVDGNVSHTINNIGLQQKPLFSNSNLESDSKSHIPLLRIGAASNPWDISGQRSSEAASLSSSVSSPSDNWGNPEPFNPRQFPIYNHINHNSAGTPNWVAGGGGFSGGNSISTMGSEATTSESCSVFKGNNGEFDTLSDLTEISLSEIDASFLLSVITHE